MWTCTPTHNPALSQSGMPEATHEGAPTTPHAVTFTSSCADMSTRPHTNKPAPPHNYSVYMTPRTLVRLHSCAPSKLSHNSTSKQESMRT